jgi:hypothetical protein
VAKGAELEMQARFFSGTNEPDIHDGGPAV